MAENNDVFVDLTTDETTDVQVINLNPEEDTPWYKTETAKEAGVAAVLVASGALLKAGYDKFLKKHVKNFKNKLVQKWTTEDDEDEEVTEEMDDIDEAVAKLNEEEAEELEPEKKDLTKNNKGKGKKKH